MWKQSLPPLLVCAFGMGLDQMQLQMGNALSAIFSVPPYSLDPTRLSWLLSAIYVGGGIGTPLLGRAADRYGLRRVLLWTVVWLGITSILSCVRDDPSWLAVLRVLIGVSLGAYPPLMITYLTSIAPRCQRGRWIFWACGLGYIATPIALFALRYLTAWHPAGLAGWRWLSIVIGMLALLACSAFQSLPEPVKPAQNAPQSAGVGMLARAPLRRTFALVATLYFLYPFGTLAFLLLTGPLLLQRGFTLNTALWYVSFATAWPVIGTLAAAWVIDRLSRRTVMLSCSVTMLGAALCFYTGATELALSIALVAFGVAQALYPAVLTTFGAESFPDGVRATATSAAWALNRVACFLVPLAVLPLLKSSGPMSVAVCVAGALLASAGITLALGPLTAVVREPQPCS